MNKKYAFFDGDNVGITIERFLTKGKIGDAQKLSDNIKKALIEIESILEKVDYVNILIIGGDDILIEFQEFPNSDKILSEIREVFYKNTGLSISCGIGNSINESIYSLHLAKLFGKNQIYKTQK